MAAVIMNLPKRKNVFKFYRIFISVILILQLFVCVYCSIRYFKKQHVQSLCTENKTIEASLDAKQTHFEMTFKKLQQTDRKFKMWSYMRKNRGRMRHVPAAFNLFNKINLKIISHHRRFFILCDSYLDVMDKLKDFKVKLLMFRAEMGYCDSLLDRLDSANMFDVWYFMVPNLEWYDAYVDKEFTALMEKWDTLQAEALLDNYFVLFESFFPNPSRNASTLTIKSRRMM